MAELSIDDYLGAVAKAIWQRVQAIVDGIQPFVALDEYELD